MKKTGKALKGPTVRYFSHGAGIVKNQKKTAQGLTILAVLLGIFGSTSMAGYGLYQRGAEPAQASQKVVATDKKNEKQPDKLVQAPTQAKEDKRLSAAIENKIAEMPKSATWSVYVRDLKSNRMASVNSDRPHTSPSFYELFLLAPLEDRLSAAHWTSKLGEHTVAACVDIMIKSPDDRCAQAIATFTGLDQIDAHNRGLGFEKTSLGQSSYQATAREAGDLMYRLQNSQLLSDKARRLVFDALYAQTQLSGIPKGCGPDCLVGNKAGGNGPVKHDVAVVTHGEAQYIVAIMTTGGSWPQLAEVARAVDASMSLVP